MNGTTIGIICAALGAIIGWLGYKRTATQDIKEETNSQIKLEMQLNYISRVVDDIKLDMKMQEKN